MAEGFSSGLRALTTGPARALVQLAEQAASTLLGRDVEIEHGARRTRLRPHTVSLSPSAAGILASRIDAVDLVADDVRWDEGRIDRLRIRARGVHVTPGFSPSLVAGPIDVEATLGQEALDEWLERFGSSWKLRLDGEGAIAATRPDRDRWGHVVVSADARDRRLTLTPIEAVVRGRRVRKTVQRFAKPIELEIPRLPADARVLRVTPHADSVEVLAMIDEVREPISARHVQQMRSTLLDPGSGPVVLRRWA